MISLSLYFQFLSSPQLAWLEETVLESKVPCVLLSHDRFERGGIRDLEAFEALLSRVNRDKKRVFFCVNGHWHQDYLQVKNGVCYFSLNSATFDWLDGRSHDRFPAFITESFRSAGKTIFWEKPVHAVITLSDDGTIKIDGMNGSYFMDVDREPLGFEPKAGDVLKTPNVLSACVQVAI